MEKRNGVRRELTMDKKVRA